MSISKSVLGSEPINTPLGGTQHRIVALLLATLLIWSLLLAPALAKVKTIQEGSPEAAVVERVAKELDALGKTDEAKDIRDRLKDGKLKINTDLPDNWPVDDARDAQTNRKGDIEIAPDLFNFPNNDPSQDYLKLVRLIRSLVHEKVHYHQGPNSPGRPTDYDGDTWDASGKAYDNDDGAFVVEVEAYYKHLQLLLKILKQVEIDLAHATEVEAIKLIMKAESDLRTLMKQELQRLKDYDLEKGNDPNMSMKDYLADTLNIDNLKTPEDKQKAIDDIQNLLDTEVKQVREKVLKYLKDERPPEKKTEKTIPGDTGGSLPLPGKETGLFVPPDAFAGALYFEIYEFVHPPAPDPGLRMLSPAYEFLPHHEFQRPVTITLPYWGEADPNSIDVYAFATKIALGKPLPFWEKITPGRSIDTVNRTISVQVDHFSLYAVMGTSQIVTGYNISWLIIIAISLILAGGYLLFRKKRKFASIRIQDKQ